MKGIERKTFHPYVTQIVNKFSVTKSVTDKKSSGNKILDELSLIVFLNHFAANLSNSLHQVSAATQFSVSSVQKVTKVHNFHPYKIKNFNELYEDDIFLEVSILQRNARPDKK